MKNPVSLKSNPHVVQTRPRQTALPASRRFASELKSTAEAGANALLRVGGAVMGAAIPAADRSSSAGSSPIGSARFGASVDGSMMDQSMDLLALQQKIQMENQRYTTLSNVLKARHETSKSAISNLR